MFTRKMIAVLILAVTIITGSVGGLAAQDTPIIRVGSKNFEESILLGHLIMVMLEENGFAVEDLTNTGNTLTVRRALLSGQLDLYAEYTGTAYSNLFANVENFTFDEATIRNNYFTYSKVAALDAAYNDVIWLTPAPANNTNAIVIRQDFAEANDLNTMSDFAAFINNGGDVFLVGSETFVSRPDALPAFEAVYDFELADSQILVIAGASSTTTEQAVSENVNGINAGMGFSTDATIEVSDLILLEDDRGAMPVFQPTPTIRGEVLRQFPQISLLLHPVFQSLDTEQLIALNSGVQVEGRPYHEVATEYLTENGFIGDEAGE
ncbi:MAG: glycine betaine ABC transporter substrate-binding protein [Chloroflexota bacterium]